MHHHFDETQVPLHFFLFVNKITLYKTVHVLFRKSSHIESMQSEISQVKKQYSAAGYLAGNCCISSGKYPQQQALGCNSDFHKVLYHFGQAL